MGKYWQTIRMSFQGLLEYRLNFLWKISGTIVNALILYGFWIAVLGSFIQREGYTTASIGLYYLFVSFVDSLTSFSYNDFAKPIYDGDLIGYLVKPYSLLKSSFCSWIPDKLITLSVGVLIYLVVRLTGVEHHLSLVSLLISIFAIFLALIMRFYVNVLIGGLAFWFKRVHGFWALFINFGGLFSGQLIPVEFLPQSMQNLSLYMPFRYLIHFPVQLLLDRPDTITPFLGMMVQLLWIGFFIVLCKFVWQKGLKQFEALGQ